MGFIRILFFAGFLVNRISSLMWKEGQVFRSWGAYLICSVFLITIVNLCPSFVSPLSHLCVSFVRCQISLAMLNEINVMNKINSSAQYPSVLKFICKY